MGIGVRGLFQRMLGSRQGPVARPFFKNKTRDEFLEWFAHVAPWSGLDSRITALIVARFDPGVIFESFVLASDEYGLVPQYIALRKFLDTPSGHLAICPSIAQILSLAAENSRSFVIRAMESKQSPVEEVVWHNRNALMALEAAVQIEPDYLPPYLQFALLRAMMRKHDEARTYCMMALERIDEQKKIPSHKSEIESVRQGYEQMLEIESQIQRLLEDLNE